MLTVDDYGRIRRAHRDGMSIREIARTFHHSRKKIREVLKSSGEPQPYQQREQPIAPKLGAFHETILEMLKEDETAPPKQRHTMMHVYRRLKAEHGYQGCYSAVRRFISKHRQLHRETFIPLDHAPGQRMEADFGEIQVDFPDGRRKVNVLILVWSYANAPFAMAFPTQRTEAILEGMTQAFEFFGCVPNEVWWDNPKTVADLVLVGRSRKINQRYAALASHYVFEPLFCMPAKGNEKPVVENRVKTLQRKWSTPVPKLKDFAELNAYLRECCIKEQDHISSGKRETIGTRLEEEKKEALSLPKYRFDPCIRQEAKVCKYQFARFDNVNYSVPRHCAFQTVSVKGYVDRVEIVFKDAVVATHKRSYEKREQILDPLHYLATLERRPAALDHSNVYRKWKLPPVFDELRERLENKHGNLAGAKQYVRVLQLLAGHPQQRVQRAIEQLRGPEGADANLIIQRVERSAEYARKHPETSETALTPEELERPEVLSVQVPCRGLDHFDQFLSSSMEGKYNHAQEKSVSEKHVGENNNAEERFIKEKRSEVAAVTQQFETTSTADNACGVRETGAGGSDIESDVRGISAATERTGGGSPCVERVSQPDQTGAVSGGERVGELRLLSDPINQQAESSGADSLRMDSPACQSLLAGSTRHGENTFGDRIGIGCLS